MIEKKVVFDNSFFGFPAPVEITKETIHQVLDGEGKVIHEGDDCMNFINSDTNHLVLILFEQIIERSDSVATVVMSEPRIQERKIMFFRPSIGCEFSTQVVKD